MSNKIVIVHFQPLEKYPPAVNFLRYTAGQLEVKNVHIITTHPGPGKKVLDFEHIHVHRVATWKKRGRLARLLFYFVFNIKSVLLLLTYKPDQVLYFETLSAFGPWVYKKWINRRSGLFIHYHEYSSIEEYRTGMALNRWLHKKERELYPWCHWLSHTNEDRMRLFLHDVGVNVPNPQIMPNYPSIEWHRKAAPVGINEDNINKIGFVYVGALSIDNMYTRQMAQYVASNQECCYWHIYSDNHDEAVFKFLASLNAENIVFKGGVPYDKLPFILPQYDIGVILYTGNTLNYAYNAPNKFFEYIACGLNVWFGYGMKGMSQYEQVITKPFVKCVDFNDMPALSLKKDKRIATIPAQKYTAEDIYKKLWAAINE